MLGIFAAILLTTAISHAQGGNTLVLKEKGRTIQSWIEKDCITFRFSNTQWIEGKIKTVFKDSLLINMYRAQQSPTMFVANSLLKGVPVLDAANTTRLLVAAGFYGIGTLQKQKHKAYLPIGKKYTMAIY